MKGTSHERIVIRGVAEHYKFGTAKGILCFGIFCRLEDYLTHEFYGIHIDARLG